VSRSHTDITAPVKANQRYLLAIYLIFFFSGLAALVYQVVWVRSFSLVFGGTHLAVTTVLAIYMAGLAIGGALFGKHVKESPLRLYGQLELGIAFLALLAFGLARVYPEIYAFFAQGHESDKILLTLIRLGFCTLSLLGPTILMGGTLPVLSRCLSPSGANISRHLSFLYGFNTLGALAGAGLTAFVFLRFMTVSSTYALAIVLNTLLGVAALRLSRHQPSPKDSDASVPKGEEISDRHGLRPDTSFSYKLVFWGIGVSGFCALGYEVLWTRILTLFIGASVYGFATMLCAFLAGIAVGGYAFGLLPKRLWSQGSAAIVLFGVVQMLIGGTAILVSYFLRDVSTLALWLADVFQTSAVGGVSLYVSFLLAFLFMFVPAFFMGMAFPLAGTAHVSFKGAVGKGVGEVLSINTVGAILGAAVSGFALIYLIGIERSLQLLIAINLGWGLLVLLSLSGKRVLSGVGLLALGSGLILVVSHPSWLQVWDQDFFAMYENNRPDIYGDPEAVDYVLKNSEVLYYGEGTEAIISVIKVKGSHQGMNVNGKTVASNMLYDRQCQLTLGHLPMLLHPEPKKVLCIGLGTGITLGATSVHPSLEKLTLVEIEPKALGAAQTFARDNHKVLDNPKLNIVHLDGRNFLLTTSERFDVITADPIHPWAQGASYLYTREYFRLASERLAPGGVMCQWLPLYEMSPQDLKSVIRTFKEQFAYTLMWGTHYDGEIIGSNSPIPLDEETLQKRIEQRGIKADLESVYMGSAREFLSYFVMGSKGFEAFGRDGVTNTDENLYLEFSTPLSTGMPERVPENLAELSRFREDIVDYLSPASQSDPQWSNWLAVTRLYDQAHIQSFWGGKPNGYGMWLQTLEQEAPWFGPGQTLNALYRAERAKDPVLIERLDLQVAGMRPELDTLTFACLLRPKNKVETSLVFVDNQQRTILAEYAFSTPLPPNAARQFSTGVMDRVRKIYEGVSQSMQAGSKPDRGDLLEKITAGIQQEAQKAREDKTPLFTQEIRRQG